MQIDQLKPNVVVRGPILPEPVQIIVTIPMVTPSACPGGNAVFMSSGPEDSSLWTFDNATKEFRQLTRRGGEYPSCSPYGK